MLKYCWQQRTSDTHTETHTPFAAYNLSSRPTHYAKMKRIMPCVEQISTWATELCGFVFSYWITESQSEMSAEPKWRWELHEIAAKRMRCERFNIILVSFVSSSFFRVQRLIRKWIIVKCEKLAECTSTIVWYVFIGLRFTTQHTKTAPIYIMGCSVVIQWILFTE